jgi:hypothetical protein
MNAPVEILILFFAILLVPLFCLALGLWVAFARPFDPNAWFVLVLLTYPQAFNPGAIRSWIPAWLALRLYWHLAVQFLAPAALFLFGLLFPERSRLAQGDCHEKSSTLHLSGLDRRCCVARGVKVVDTDPVSNPGSTQGGAEWRVNGISARAQGTAARSKGRKRHAAGGVGRMSKKDARAIQIRSER